LSRTGARPRVPPPSVTAVPGGEPVPLRLPSVAAERPPDHPVAARWSRATVPGRCV